MSETERLLDWNRREFLRGSSLMALATLLGGVRLIRPEAAAAEPEPAPTEKVKVGLIGLGQWGRELLDQLLRLPQAEVAAICDNYPAMLRRSAKRVPDAMATEDYRALLENKEIPAVVVATPTHLHRDIVLAALEAGKHVYCEAPLAHTVEDARAIAQAALKHNRQVFQPGLQLRSDPQRHFLLPFVRSGALGRMAMARAQWNKKTSWRQTSPNPEREAAVNWRLARETSLGLLGEVGIHQIDQVSWFFGAMPTAVHAFGTVAFWRDGREVHDTVQAVVEYPEGLRLLYSATLANSFESEAEIYYGSDAAVMIRGSSAWMFKEADAPLLGWEVYARKDAFYKETGISLRADASKLRAQGDQAQAQAEATDPPVYFALQSFLRNCREVSSAVQDFVSLYGDSDPQALAEYLAKEVRRLPAADALDGYRATVLAIKASESATTGRPVSLPAELFELS
ncbi:Gfo/Idh/MocA family oxidoreductase [Limisphaera sp. VF-2]|jgi:predicted dehydrogenase|uniref:Gfo/Idh/MocA family oxidoreductase n=1 Tax=Limisphaera sp. VF-2 TaxID=3400418 RepID=UPI00256154A8|nr:Gfo/Idh/MocA family oxidoreductase [Limisphaera sp.]